MTTVRKNFLLLMTLQISTYVVPLVTLPLLTRVLGPEAYGQLSFVLAVITYFINFTNYSFDLTATPRIALAHDDLAARSKIFWATFAAQAAITVAGFAILLALTFAIERFAIDRTLLVIGFGMTVGAALTPGWYFQGIQKLRIYSVTLFACRALSVPAMYLCVRTPADLIDAVAINAAVPLVCGVLVFGYLIVRREVVFVRIGAADVAASLKGGWQVFLASTSVAFYASTNTVLLGFVSGNVAAGYFAAGDKLIRSAISLLQPLKAAAYPHVSYLMHHAREDAMSFLRKLLVVQGAMVLAISLAIFALAPLAVHILYGSTYEPTVGVLRCMALIPFMAGMTDLFGVQTMLPLGMKTAFSRVLISSGVLNVALLPPLAKCFAEQGAAAAVLIAETAVAATLAYVLYRKRVSIFARPAPRPASRG
ncbi:flippase [Burkholderia pseudomallei]|uniref:flippase n=1 Tax=Burkholderia pseudomallei TaxID=28450 RepID=UPI00052A4913|nr:flippase [Burkholderia pseudomallei]AIV84468.1 polysaccharide biosynthesis family protein [Burkholderia pseudomallei MSHR3965]KGS24056.1 polysaccharide biosynthesis family protein [Burkholderia pseudomallei MSHR4378]KGS99870.1 polysaccharide biosynthesis family protein [Burkholderia pseudomallei]KGU71150.1 polysaccharide biosynthesis family protein [Burkholderia pseudomallei MSHR4304]KGV30293.1 polysaccharide biosynthesis family protein [Burkholderia pseudomallei MSHR4308]